MHRTTSNDANSLPLNGRRRRAEIIAENKADTYAGIVQKAADLDERRQKQIDAQARSLTDFVAFIEEKDLMAEYVVWKTARHAT